MKYLTLLCCLVLVSGAYAQEDVLRPGTTGGGSSSSSSGRSSSSSRTPVAIGVDIGINYNLFSQNVDNYPPNPVYEPFESGSGFSPFFDAYVDIGLSKSIGVQLKLGYDMKNYGDTKEITKARSGYFYFEGMDPIFGSDTASTIRQEFDITSAYFTIAPLLRINATDQLFFTVGPSIQFPVGKIKQEEKLKTLNPEAFNPIFLDANGDGLPDDLNNNGRTDDDWGAEYSPTVEFDDPQSPRIAIEAGAGYLIPLTANISLVPKLGFQYFFSPILKKKNTEYIGTDGETHDAKPTVHSVQLSIGVLFGL